MENADFVHVEDGFDATEYVTIESSDDYVQVGGSHGINHTQGHNGISSAVPGTSRGPTPHFYQNVYQTMKSTPNPGRIRPHMYKLVDSSVSNSSLSSSFNTRNQLEGDLTSGTGANLPSLPFSMVNTKMLSSAPKPPKPRSRKSVPGQKKPCNCTKSMCLKLYCDCFANGEFCDGCNCKDCHNTIAYEADRTKAIKQSLERNPNAFKPKIGATNRTAGERLHQKGCHCKKSGCLKNYCECYEAKVPCTDRCKCNGCRNTEVDRAQRYKDKGGGGSLMNLAVTASSLAAAEEAGRSTPFSDEEEEPVPIVPDPKGSPWFYMTEDVLEAATMCMVAQAEEALRENAEAGMEEMEKQVLIEFGRCLRQIIDSSHG